jgi:hypothetical protein
MTGKAAEIYKYLEPLYNDYRKLAYRGINGWELIRMDEFIDILLCNELACDVALPFLPKRLLLEDSGILEPRKSILEDEIDDSDEDEEKDETDKLMKEKKKKKTDSLIPIVSSEEPEGFRNVITAVENEVEMSSTQLKNQEKIEQMKNFVTQETQAKEIEKTNHQSQIIAHRDGEQGSRGQEMTSHHRDEDRRDHRERSRERTTDRSRDRRDRDHSRDRERASERRDRSHERRRSRDRSRDRGGRRSRDDDRRRDRSRDRERRRDRSRGNDRRRGRSRDRDRSRDRHSRRSPSTSSRSSSSRRSRSRDDRKHNSSYHRSDSPKKYLSTVPPRPVVSTSAPPPFPLHETEKDDDFDKILDKDGEATPAINPYKFKYTAKKFDKMFGKKTKASATAAPTAGTIPPPASKSSSHAAEEGSVEYWNQLRESLGIKKLK